MLQVRSQGVTEELKCLSLLNALHKDPDIPEQLAQLLGEPCMKLAEGIKAYISKVRSSLPPQREGCARGESAWKWVQGKGIWTGWRGEHLGGMM